MERVARWGFTRVPRFLLVNAGLACLVWLVWAILFREEYPGILGDHWEIALTMVFGSLVGGGTSEGGGAVAFPVLTKLLSVPADQARIFTFAIQSVGMVSASISILLCRVPVEKRVIFVGAPPAVVGVIVSATCIAPHVPSPSVRMGFTTVLVALGIALWLQARSSKVIRQPQVPAWGTREKMYVGLTGGLGGLVSGVAGVGENTVMFILLVLLFRVCEKVATPTTVILMSIVSVAGFATHVLVMRDFKVPVSSYWVAAVPVVAVGAPLGAWLCTRLRPATVRQILVALIVVELLSTLFLVPLTPQTLLVGVVGLTITGTTCLALIRSTRYSGGPL